MNASITVGWSDMKSFLDSRNVTCQWVIINDSYRIWGNDNGFMLHCSLPMDGGADQLAFEASYKAAGNKTPLRSVTTQFEAKDKTLKLASGVGAVDATTGVATVQFKVPGTPGSADGRFLDEGVVWFDQPDSSDVVSVHIVDVDNIMGYGANTVIGSYTDDEMPASQQGWRVPMKRGQIEVTTLGFYGFAPAGLYIVVKGQKTALKSGNMIINLKWGKIE